MQSIRENSLYIQAFAYMADGYSVIPINKDKKPLVSWRKYQKEKADEKQIEKWWSKYPSASIGIVTGAISNITVVDIDVKNDKKTPLNTFPKTKTIQTPSGGFHLYYKYSDYVSTGANQFGAYPYVDIRNDRGYVIAPPSDGYKAYDKRDIADFPADIFPKTKKKKQTNELINVKSGNRNDSITSLIGRILATTQEERWAEDAWPVIQAVNNTYSPPLRNDELKRTFQSIAGREKERRKESITSPLQLSNTDTIKYQLRKNKNGTPHKDMTNAVFAIQVSEKYGGKIRWEMFSGTIEINGRLKDDEDTLEIQKFLQNEIELYAIGRAVTEDAIQRVAFENKYDAAKEYIEGLKWDGVPRVDTWLSRVYSVENDKYTRDIGSNWLRALVKRIMRPGTKFDYVLVVEGEQGVKKTMSFAVLGKPWHVETIVEAQSKDFLMQFQGKAIVELSEGDTLTRSEVKTLKAILTRTHDKYRAPYGRHDEEHPRRCVFCMTTNDDAYLKDDTGNRRWWPIRMPDGVQADVEWLKENRDQLFAEAYHRIEEDIWNIPEDRAREEQDKRRMTDEMEEDIYTWYVALSESKREEGVLTKHFLEWFYRDQEFRMPKNDRLLELRIGSHFRTVLGLKKQSKKIEGKVVRRFFPTQKTPAYDSSYIKNDFSDW